MLCGYTQKKDKRGRIGTVTAGKDRTQARRRLSPDERREQIVAGAVRYFAQVGLDGNTRELSKRLGVTQSLIFNYFSTKSDLIEAVYHSVYLDRLSPTWPVLITDRSQSLRDRMITFYTEYAEAIFTYDWMRIFMFSGLAGTRLNGRYLDHLSEFVLRPLLGELRAANPDLPPEMQPDMEDVWNLHGGIVYIGIRRYVYQMPCPNNPQPAILSAIDRFLAGLSSPDRAVTCRAGTGLGCKSAEHHTT